ncbi:MAG: Rpn family recombination-promoting nuclease/putative transposase, partial [Desulfonatronovibrio sp.]
IREKLILEEIRYEKDTFLPSHLKEYFSDLLTSVPVKGQKCEVKPYFLFEHKSYYPKSYPLQVLRYLLEIWDQYQNITGSTGKKLPLIIPVLITHSESGWEKQNISDLVDIPSEDFRTFIPDFEHILYDSVNENPEDYDFIETLKALLVIWRYFDSPDFIKHLTTAFKLIKQVRPETKFRDFVISFMEYLSQSRKKEEYIEIFKIAEKEFSEGDDVMETIADMFRKEGYHDAIMEKPQWVTEGEVKKARDSVIKAANSRLGILHPEIVNRIKKIESLEILDALFDFSLRAESMDQFTDQVRKITDN